METIVKYSNRKLYSNVESGYIELPAIVDRFVSGITFQVLSYESGTDITQDVIKSAFLNSKLSLAEITTQLNKYIKNNLITETEERIIQ